MGVALCKNGHLIHANGFYKNGECKQCNSVRSRRWRESNQERAKGNDRKYYIENREKRKAARKDWYTKNKERARRVIKDWEVRNPEKLRDKQIRFRTTNREKLLAKSRERAEVLVDCYVCNILCLKVSDVPQEVIELKRQHIILKREIKKWKQSQL